ncbi:hypothetical protein D1007_22740 [Hordeum vulgare]|nr:hypothetical protein D1007_22740 [Hordeum vulgare]
MNLHLQISELHTLKCVIPDFLILVGLSKHRDSQVAWERLGRDESGFNPGQAGPTRAIPLSSTSPLPYCDASSPLFLFHGSDDDEQMIAAATDDYSDRKEQDHITDGQVAHIYVEYNGEQDEEGEDGSASGFDFENEMQDHMDSGTEEEMTDIMTAEEVQVGHQNDNVDEDLLQQVLVPNDNGVITSVISSPLKRRSSEACNLS